MVQKMSAFLTSKLNEEKEACVRIRVHICKKYGYFTLGGERKSIFCNCVFCKT